MTRDQFDEIITREYDNLLKHAKGYCSRIPALRGQGQDVLQAVILHFLDSPESGGPPRYEDLEDHGAFANGILLRSIFWHAQNIIRGNATDQTNLRSYALYRGDASPELSNIEFQQIIDRELERIVNPKLRQAIEMRLAGFTLSEVEGGTGIPQGSIKSGFRRFKGKLHEELGRS